MGPCPRVWEHLATTVRRQGHVDWLLMENHSLENKALSESRLLKLLASQMDPQNRSITTSKLRDLRSHLLESFIAQ